MNNSKQLLSALLGSCIAASLQAATTHICYLPSKQQVPLTTQQVIDEEL